MQDGVATRKAGQAALECEMILVKALPRLIAHSGLA
jgi:hypothetical protein